MVQVICEHNWRTQVRKADIVIPSSLVVNRSGTQPMYIHQNHQPVPLRRTNFHFCSFFKKTYVYGIDYPSPWSRMYCNLLYLKDCGDFPQSTKIRENIFRIRIVYHGCHPFIYLETAQTSQIEGFHNFAKVFT